MAADWSRPGPFDGLPDGYREPARGVLYHGHVGTMPTAYFARDRLTDPAASAEDRRRGLVCLQTIVDAQITQSVIATMANVAGLDGRGTWYGTIGDTAGGGPQFNFEDFTASAILQIFHHDPVAGHADFPKGLYDRLRECLAEAVGCSHRRNVRVSYTNPVAMSIECSALAGEYLGEGAMLDFARRRLAEWRTFTEGAGTFEEFNSSCYGGVTLPHVAYLVEHVHDRDIRAGALHMERLYFDHVCDFYHGPTGELSPPQSRCYSDRFLGTQLQDYLYHVLAGRGLAAEAERAGLRPPPARRLGCQYFSHATGRQVRRLLRAFVRPVERRMYCEWIGRDHVGPLGQVPPRLSGDTIQAGLSSQCRQPVRQADSSESIPVSCPPTTRRRRELTCLRTRDFCLGSVNEIDCGWEQRRALGAFIAVGLSGDTIRARQSSRCRQPVRQVDPSESPIPVSCPATTMLAWKPVIAVGDLPDGEQGRHWPTLQFFNLCSGQDGRTVLAGLTGMPVDGGWLCGSHWRQKVAGRVEWIQADFGFDLAGPLAGEPPPIEIGRPWRMEIGPCTVTLLLAGGHVGPVQASPVVRRADAGQGVPSWRISLVQLNDFVLDWSDPPEVGLAMLLDVSPTRRSPRDVDLSWQVRGTELACQAAVDGRRLALRYAPPAMGRLTSQAVQFTVA